MRSLLLFIFVHLVSLADLAAQGNINRYKNGRKQGKWIAYSDSTHTRVDHSGRYRKGFAKGLWKYYDEESRLIKKERIIFRTIHTTLYHRNGKISKKGKARITQNDSLSHYYYYGPWKTYNTSGQLLKTQQFELGRCVSENIILTEAEPDTVRAFIRRLYADFFATSDSLQTLEKRYTKGSSAYNSAVSKYNGTVLMIFEQVDSLIAKHGFPGKTLAGQDYAMVFAMISSSRLQIKEKYYNDICAAADRQELDWYDVAFFVDKVKVGRKEKQLYGTQFIISDMKLIYYPIERVGLNERRKKVGLWELDLLQTEDTLPYSP